MLKGYKTYIVIALAVLTALLGYFNGEITLLQAVQAAALAVGIGGNRALVRAAAILNSPYQSVMDADPKKPAVTVYIAAGVAILTALLAYANGEQDLIVTAVAVLGALGVNFLGAGVKKVADGQPL